MNAQAQVLAQGFARFGDADTLHIYLDGVVVVLGGGSDRHLDYRVALGKQFPDFQETRLTGKSAFVVRLNVGRTEPGDLSPWLVEPTHFYTDHRSEDANTIDGALALFEAAFAPSDSK